MVHQNQIHFISCRYWKEGNMFKYLDILPNISGQSLAFALGSVHISRSFLLKSWGWICFAPAARCIRSKANKSYPKPLADFLECLDLTKSSTPRCTPSPGREENTPLLSFFFLQKAKHAIFGWVSTLLSFIKKWNKITTGFLDSSQVSLGLPTPAKP